MRLTVLTGGEDKTPPARRVRNFLARMEKELRHHPMWRAETHDPDRWQTTVDAMGTHALPAQVVEGRRVPRFNPRSVAYTAARRDGCDVQDLRQGIQRAARRTEN